MKYQRLSDIQWHDLHVESIRISAGSVELHVCPYDEALARHDTARLKLTGPRFEFDIVGPVSTAGADEFELYAPEIDSTEGPISGRIVLLIGDPAVPCSIMFQGASWTLVDEGHSA